MIRGFQRISWGQQDVGSPLGNAWASRSAGAMGVALWVFLFLQQNMTVGLLLLTGTARTHHVLGTEATR